MPVIGLTREHSEWAGTESIRWTQETVAAFDIVIIATAHSCVNYVELGEWARCIVDTRNVMSGVPMHGKKIWKA